MDRRVLCLAFSVAGISPHARATTHGGGQCDMALTLGPWRIFFHVHHHVGRVASPSPAMNNQQFRRLLLSETAKQDGSNAHSPATASTPRTALGARKHSSIPMTPSVVLSRCTTQYNELTCHSRQAGNRNSIQADFARQLAERNAKANPGKKVKASAPKGTKLAPGYIDRTRNRADGEENEITKRIKNLEELLKQGEIDRDTFDGLVQDITGGDLSTTHLVKGLDRKLLERVRRGEDVLAAEVKDQPAADDEETPDVENAFDELAATNVGTIMRAKAEKKGEKMLSPPAPVAGMKRSRNDILKELKRQREEAAAAAAAEHEKRFPSLGPGFRKITATGEAPRLEVDEKGREVLIIKGPDGKEKRKVRKQKVEQQPADKMENDPDDATKAKDVENLPLPKMEDSEDEDIFEGVGSNYNPLADFDDDGDDDDDGDGVEDEGTKQGTEQEADILQDDSQSTSDSNSRLVDEFPSQEGASSGPSEQRYSKTTAKDTETESAKRDYFKSTRRTTADHPSNISSTDATVRAALAKVRNLDDNSTLLQNLAPGDPNDAESKEARLKKRAMELAGADRDMEDMDLGFGASRFDDAEDMEREGEKVKFSQWKGLGAEEDEDEAEGTRDAKKQRKRGPKKKRGDKNKAEDVLKVMERQKEKKTLG